MPARPLHCATFDSAGLDPAEAFAQWSSLMAGFKATLPDGPKNFSVMAWAWMLGPLIVTRTQVSSIRLARPPELLAADHIDHYVFVLQLSGDWQVEIGNRIVRSAPGITCIFDKSQPFRTEARTEVDIIIVMVPRAALEPAAGALDLHGQALRSEAGRLLSDYLHVLVNRLPSLTEAEAPYIGEATLEIMRSCVRATGAQHRNGKPVDIVRRAARLVDRNPAEPLTAGQLQSALHLSRSSLYRAFEPLGGVAFFIRDRRLARIHAMVSAGERASVSRLAEMFGFASGAQLRRAFDAHFGYSISELRARTRLASANGISTAAFYQGWQKSVS